MQCVALHKFHLQNPRQPQVLCLHGRNQPFKMRRCRCEQGVPPEPVAAALAASVTSVTNVSLSTVSAAAVSTASLSAAAVPFSSQVRNTCLHDCAPVPRPQ